MNPTGSSIERASLCPASHALPGYRESSRYAEAGTAVHSFLEVVSIDWAKRDEALSRLAGEDLSACQSIMQEDMFEAIGDLRGVRCEAAFAYDVAARKSRLLGYGIARDYGHLSQDEIALTIDVVGVREDGVPVALDWKNGSQDVTEPGNNWQMRAAALAAFGVVDECEVRIVYTRERPFRVERATFDMLDLDEHAAGLQRIVARIRKAEADVAAGRLPVVSASEKACQYCGCVASCPAKTGLARRMVPELANVESQILTLTPEQAGVAWLKVKEAKSLVERVERGLKQLADNGSVHLPDGKEVRPIEKRKSYTNADAALALAEKYGASPGELAECVKTTSYNEYRSVKRKGDSACPKD